MRDGTTDRIRRLATLSLVGLMAGCGGASDTATADTTAAGPRAAAASGQASTSGESATGQAAGQGESEHQPAAQEPAGQQAGAGQPAGASAHPGIRLTAAQREDLGIRVEALEGGSARSIVGRPASLRIDPDRKALVGPRIESKVVRVVRDLGDRVSEGDTLAVLSSVALGKAKSDFLTARARLRTAEAEVRRERGLYEQEISSEAELLESEARFVEARAERDAAREALRLYGLPDAEVEAVEPDAPVPLSYFALRSPVSGRVQRRDLSPGQTVSPRETPIHVASLDRLWVMIEAYDHDVPLLEEGRPIRLSVQSLPGRTFEGEIDWISYELDPETRTLAVRAVVENSNGALRGGMYGTARLDLSSEVRNALVPVDAAQTLEGGDVVFVPGEEPGHFRPVDVRLGDESEDGWVEILSGVRPGDSAVVAGAFDLMSAATAAGRGATHAH